MKKLIHILVLLLITSFTASVSFSGEYKAVTISKPMGGTTVSSPVKVCMTAWGVEFEPSKKGINDGKGHNHILVDVGLPSDLSKPIAKDSNHIHMGDGSFCKTIKLAPGKHTVRSLFAKGNHVPYDPPLTDVIEVTIK